MDINTIQKDSYDGNFSISHKISHNGLSRNLHYHDEYELHYTVQGGKNFVVEGNVYEVEDGDLFLLNNNEIHKPIALPGVFFERYIITVNPDILNTIMPQHSVFLKKCFQMRRSGYSNRIHLSFAEREEYVGLLERILQLDEKTIGYEVLHDIYCIELLTYVIQKFLTMDISVAARSQFKHPAIEATLDYINMHFQEDITLSDLADQLHISKNYLCQIFKETTGITIMNFVIAKRMSHAKYLLIDNYSVADVATNSGFNDYVHFIRTFKKFFGMSPNKYKNKFKSQSSVSQENTNVL